MKIATISLSIPAKQEAIPSKNGTWVKGLSIDLIPSVLFS